MLLVFQMQGFHKTKTNSKCPTPQRPSTGGLPDRGGPLCALQHGESDGLETPDARECLGGWLLCDLRQGGQVAGGEGSVVSHSPKETVKQSNISKKSPDLTRKSPCSNIFESQKGAKHQPSERRVCVRLHDHQAGCFGSGREESGES